MKGPVGGGGGGAGLAAFLTDAGLSQGTSHSARCGWGSMPVVSSFEHFTNLRGGRGGIRGVCVCVGEGTGKGGVGGGACFCGGVSESCVCGCVEDNKLVVELVCPMQGRPRSGRHLEYAGITAVRFLLFCFFRLITQFFCPCHKKFKNSLSPPALALSLSLSFRLSLSLSPLVQLSLSLSLSLPLSRPPLVQFSLSPLPPLVQFTLPPPLSLPLPPSLPPPSLSRSVLSRSVLSSLHLSLPLPPSISLPRPPFSSLSLSLCLWRRL